MEINTSKCEVESIQPRMQEPSEAISEDSVDAEDHIDGYNCADLSIEFSLDNEHQHLKYFINNDPRNNENNKNIDDDDNDDDDDEDEDEDDEDDDNDGDDEEDQLTNYSDVDLPSDSNKHSNVINYDGRFSRRKKKKKKDDVIDRVVSESESERFSIPRSSSVSIERFSIRANYDSSDFSRTNSISNEKFHSDFSLAVASASSGDCISIPTSDPFSVRNLDFAASAFSLGRVNSYSEKFSDIYSTKNSDFSTRNSTDFRTTQSEEERFSDDSLEEVSPSIATTLNTPIIPSSSTTTAAVAGTTSAMLFPPFYSMSTVAQPKIQVTKRHSIAWEVPFEQNSLYAPGSTKVVGRRRRRSSDVSSISSTYKLHDLDYDWREYDSYRRRTSDNDITNSTPISTVFSVDVTIDAKNSTNKAMNNNNNNKFNELMFKQDLIMKNNTYIIRGRTRKKKHFAKRYSNTFDDIKSLLREGKLQGLNDPPPDFVPPPVPPPDLVRVLSLPIFHHKQKEELKSACHRDVISESSNDMNLKHEERNSAVLHTSTTINTPIFTTITTTTITNTQHSSSSSSLSTLPALSNHKNKKCQKSKYSEYANLTSNSLPISNNNSGIIHLPNSNYSNKMSSLKLAENQFELYNFNKLVNPTVSVDCNNQSKIPVTVLIEDQIVKKALNENRRQLEKVSDALKELETVRSNDTQSLKNEQERIKDGIDMLEFDMNSSDKILHNDNINPESKYLCGKPNDTVHQYLHISTDVKNYDNQMTENSTTNKLRTTEEVVTSELENSNNSRFQINVEMIEFPPLPPSPVEEADEENFDVINTGYSNVNSSSHKNSSHNLPISVPSTRHVPTGRVSEYRPQVPPHRIPLSSLTNVKDDRPLLNTSRKNEISNERCTLSTDLPGPSSGVRSKKRISAKSSLADSAVDNGMTDKKYTPSKINSGMQTSCSLPETPVFARGCDTNSRIVQYVSTASSTLSIVATTTTTTVTSTTPVTTKITPITSEGVISQIRRQPSWYGPTISTTGGYRRNNPNLEEALIGTELLRLAGGPNRGWYPTRRSTTNQPRPASIEHLERLNSAYGSRFSNAAYSGDFLQRKPLTLPTNITPNKFFGHQSKHSTVTSGTREALRRVTSLLIKKGVGVKSDGKNGASGKDGHSSGSSFYSGCDSTSSNDGSRKKGFFKSFWKRSRHYSLENQ
ncbi:MATH and LRR domain-containing protein PFE0570w isoform X2 [Chelonus insularis]|uniref:MATH and LRR domain-containing protein PFE0570w isoform X2 n=1 Tax=Chelonus insularis TaxID=460826 RepID=UPI00158DDEDA|nr:MATH and LRR domain-containing protein PFE0570w isoform X2 [Chelonus insularis]